MKELQNFGAVSAKQMLQKLFPRPHESHFLLRIRRFNRDTFTSFDAWCDVHAKPSRKWCMSHPCLLLSDSQKYAGKLLVGEKYNSTTYGTGLTDKTITIVEIPSYFNGKEIAEIGAWAFACNVVIQRLYQRYCCCTSVTFSFKIFYGRHLFHSKKFYTKADTPYKIESFYRTFKIWMNV